MNTATVTHNRPITDENGTAHNAYCGLQARINYSEDTYYSMNGQDAPMPTVAQIEAGAKWDLADGTTACHCH